MTLGIILPSRWIDRKEKENERTETLSVLRK